MDLHVSAASIASIWTAIILGVVLVIAPVVYLRKKFKTEYYAWTVGALIFFVFALVLESAPKQVFLASLMQGDSQNIWLISLVAGLCAGVFEETGRLFAFSVLLKKHRGNDMNALMYGAGHGGCEVVFIVLLTMVNNLVYANAVNSGNAAAMIAAAEGTQAQVLQQTFEQLAGAQPVLFLVSILERIIAMGAHIALSVIVWAACKKPAYRWLFAIAILLHTWLDFIASLLSLMNVPVVVIELETLLNAVLCIVVAIRVWKKVLKAPAAAEPAVEPVEG